MNQTVDISHHAPALATLAARHGIPVTEVIEKILRHGIEREYEIFDWSPAPIEEIEPEPIEVFVPERIPEPVEERQSA
jgi:hypothetical protein